MDRKFTATVVRATGSWYDVLHDGETVRCRIRGRLRLKGVRSTNPVVVGDEVACEADEGGDYVIADILPEAQNAPADVLKKAMLDAARTLCRRSKVWRVDVEGTLIPGIAQVELELPRETSVVDVAYLYYWLHGKTTSVDASALWHKVGGTCIWCSSKENLYSRMKTHLANGGPCILHVKSSAGQHWVVVRAYKDNTFYIADPWNGKLTTLDKSGYSLHGDLRVILCQGK